MERRIRNKVMRKIIFVLQCLQAIVQIISMNIGMAERYVIVILCYAFHHLTLCKGFFEAPEPGVDASEV